MSGSNRSPRIYSSWVKGLLAVAILHGANANAEVRAAPLDKRGYYLEKCEQPTGDWRSTCLGYINGLIDMYEALSLFSNDTNPWRDLCIPRTVTIGALEQLLIQRIRSRKTDARLGTAHVLLDAIKEA